MLDLKEIKCCFSKKMQYILISGTIVLSIIGTGVGYVLYKNDKISFSDWLAIASREELKEVYKKMRLEFGKTGIKPFGMEQINRELGKREAKEWFEKHPPNLDPMFRWTDANRWDKD